MSKVKYHNVLGFDIYSDMIEKRRGIKEAVTAFACEISPKASKDKYNKAWDKLCKKIDKLI